MDSLIVFGAKYLFLFVLLGAVVPLFVMHRDERKGYVLTSIFAAILAFVFAKSAGALYFDPRPFTHGVRALIPHEPDNGFPSDHTTLSFVASVLVLRFSKPIAMGLVSLAAIVGVCRVLSGVHSPIDILGGAIFGSVASIVASMIVNRLTLSPRTEATA